MLIISATVPTSASLDLGSPFSCNGRLKTKIELVVLQYSLLPTTIVASTDIEITGGKLLSSMNCLTGITYSLFHINWCRLCIRVSAKKVEVKI